MIFNVFTSVYVHNVVQYGVTRQQNLSIQHVGVAGQGKGTSNLCSCLTDLS